MRLHAHNYLAAISFLSLGLISTGCGKSINGNSDNNADKFSSLFFKSSSDTDKFAFLDKASLNDQQEQDFQKLIDLELKYDDYQVKIDKQDETSPWKLYATIYVDQKPHQINLTDNSIDSLEDKLSSEIISNKPDDIIELEKNFDITIDSVSKQGKTEFKVTDNNTGQKDTYKNLHDIKTVFVGMEANSAYIAKKAKTIKYLIRKMRGKDSHNQVINLKTQGAGKALVIDGFDDLASAIENSGLPKHLELSIKSSIYMLFGGAVFIGYEGASEEYKETREEYQESIEEAKKLRKELLTNMENEIEAKEMLLKSISTNNEALTPGEKVAREVAMENAKFKLEFVKEIQKALTKKTPQTSLNSRIFSKLVNLIHTHNEKIKSLKGQVSEAQTSSRNYNELFQKLKTVDSIKLLPSADQEYVVEKINSLFEYQKGLNESLSKHFESISVLPNINRGLASMYYGMVAFEAKTLSELITLKSSAEAGGIASTAAFQNYLTAIEGIGNGFLAAGQAQMVLAGLTKIGENTKEIKSLNAWIEDMRKSPYWDEVKRSNLDSISKNNILKTKKILDSFYSSKRNWIITRSVGDSMLTAGQATMLLSGPLLLGVPAFSGVGAGSTILGIVTSQMSDQYIGHSFEFEEADGDSKEAKISRGDFDNDSDPYFVKLLDRSAQLVELSNQKSQVRVWQKIYDTLISNPNLNANEIISTLKSDWEKKNSKINAAKKDYYSNVYLESLNKIFPADDLATKNKNIVFINEAKNLFNSIKGNNEQVTSNNSIKFINFVTSHLQLLNTRIENSSLENLRDSYSPIVVDEVKSTISQSENSAHNIKNIFSFFDEFGLSGELDRRIVKKIILQDGFPFTSKQSVDDKKLIAKNYLKEVVVKTNKQPWNVPNPLPGFFVYYFPQFSESGDKPSKPLIFSKKDKSIYIFDRKQFLNDLDNYENLSQDTKNSVDEFTKIVFDVQDFNEPTDKSFFNKLQKIKGIFGRDLRSVFKLTYDGVAKTIFRANALRPITDGIGNQIDNYNSLNNIKANYKTSIPAKISKYTYKGIKKFSSAANKYNVGMNFILMPQTISGINQSVANGDIAGATRGSLSFSVNNADLLFDLARNAGGKTFWMKNPKTFQGIGSVQVVLNVASAGLDIWQAVELFKAAESATDQRIKTDLYVNASFTTATAATSLGTALLLPLTAKAGPIGAAIGFTIMFGQGTYNAVRTSEELREMGFNEEYVVLNSISSFFGQYSPGEDPRFVTRKSEREIETESIPKIMEENNNEFLKAIRNPNLKNSYYFKKIVYPKISMYVPYTHGQISLYCAYGMCSTHKTVIPKPIESEKHMCLKNNSHYDVNNDLKNTMGSEHERLVHENHFYLAKKATPIPLAPKGESFGGHGGRTNFNSTTPCPTVNDIHPMVEKVANRSSEYLKELAKNPKLKEQEANLYLVGIGDQGKHGNMISSIIAEKNSKNLFNIHPSTFAVQLVGGDKEDIFEFYDYVQGNYKHGKTNGFIDGGEGIDTINLQGMPEKPKYERMVINLIENKSSSKHFVNAKNIENVMGSNNGEDIIGNDSDNVIFGNGGDDKINTGLGNDIIYPGTGNDTLIGGAGNDVYVILKNDISPNTEKIIENFDFSEIPYEQKYDAIMTDMQNLVSQKNGRDLLLGYIENDSFVSVIRVKKYFQDKNYQHLVISDTKGNVYTTPSGLLFNESDSENNNDIYGYNSINTVNMKTKSAIVKLDEKTQYNLSESAKRDEFKVFNISQKSDKLNGLKKDNFNLNFKNVIGTPANEIILGDNQNNFLNGLGGLDYIEGFDGDDTILMTLESKGQYNAELREKTKEQTISNYVNGKKGAFSRLSGGKGHDAYILTLPSIYNQDNKPVYVEIDNNDKSMNIDSLIINNPSDYSGNIISNVFFSKVKATTNDNEHLKITLHDSVTRTDYIVIVKKWFNSNTYRHMRIQIGNKLSIPESVLEMVTNTLESEAYKNLDEKTLESDAYKFSINDRYIALNQRMIEVERSSYNVIEASILPKKENSIEFKHVMSNSSSSNSNKSKMKFTRFENDMIIQFEPSNNGAFSSFSVLKDYYVNEEFQRKDFTIKLNEQDFMHAEDFRNLTQDLREDTLVKMEI